LKFESHNKPEVDDRYKCCAAHCIKINYWGDNHDVGIKESVLSDVSVYYGIGNVFASLD